MCTCRCTKTVVGITFVADSAISALGAFVGLMLFQVADDAVRRFAERFVERFVVSSLNFFPPQLGLSTDRLEPSDVRKKNRTEPTFDVIGSARLDSTFRIGQSDEQPSRTDISILYRSP